MVTRSGTVRRCLRRRVASAVIFASESRATTLTACRSAPGCRGPWLARGRRPGGHCVHSSAPGRERRITIRREGRGLEVRRHASDRKISDRHLPAQKWAFYQRGLQLTEQSDELRMLPLGFRAKRRLVREQDLTHTRREKSREHGLPMRRLPKHPTQ